MRWRNRRESDNIEDIRSEGGLAGQGGGFRLPGPMRGRGGKIGGLGLILIIVLALAFGIDPSAILQGGASLDGGRSVQPRPAGRGSAGNTELRRFVAVVLADTEDVWHGRFKALGRTYREPKLVLYKGYVRSACGLANAAMGPFYCPGDQKVYLDFGFFDELKRRFRAAGDFAQAYVIAHEVAHHVQTLLGISEKFNAARRRVGRAQANALSVRFELQADCFAGVWAHHAQRTKKILEQGDVEEALRAASAIGDDNIQRQTQGRVAPESFTHGTSEQRVRWFRRGFQSGRLRDCDTFRASRL